MIRHIELIKLAEVYEGKYRAEQIEELTAQIKAMLESVEGIASHRIDSKSDSLDPMDADMCIQIDFESQDALDEFDLSVEHLAVSIKIAEHAESILDYDVEI